MALDSHYGNTDVRLALSDKGRSGITLDARFALSHQNRFILGLELAGTPCLHSIDFSKRVRSVSVHLLSRFK